MRYRIQDGYAATGLLTYARGMKRKCQEECNSHMDGLMEITRAEEGQKFHV